MDCLNCGCPMVVIEEHPDGTPRAYQCQNLDCVEHEDEYWPEWAEIVGGYD